VVKAGRPYLAALIAAANQPKRLSYYVFLTKPVKDDLRWWVEFLENFTGRVPLPAPVRGGTGESRIETDASDVGFGARFADAWFSHPVGPSHAEWSINMRELFAVAMAILTWSGVLRARTVFVFCDNEAVVKIIDKGRSKHNGLNAMVRGLYQTAASGGMQVMACHVAGACNAAADALSRLRIDEFRRIVPSANSSMTPIIMPFLSQ
jgi:hypothetical protein